MKLVILAAALASAAAPATAQIIVSGDTNIFGEGGTPPFSQLPKNEQFLRNIAGTSVLIQGTSVGDFAATPGELSAYLQSQGIASSIVASTATLTAADFAGRTLFVGILPNNAYQASEISLFSSFLGNGGKLLFTGEGAGFSTAGDLNINAALVALGSDLRINLDSIDGGSHTATVASNNAYTAGTSGFQYAYTASVSGGTALYQTTAGNQTFIATDATFSTAAVPEPATWGMAILGLGIAGGALRRRGKIATRVNYAI